jgi:hypothetical protein
VEDDVLTISGETEEHDEETGRTYLHRERRFGARCVLVWFTRPSRLRESWHGKTTIPTRGAFAAEEWSETC